MAGDWIKMREDLFEDPAVLRMAQELRVRPETVVGYCHRFWGWVSRQCHDGVVTGVTLESVGNVIALPGFPELLVRAEWLGYDDSNPACPRILIPKFERHLSEGAKARALAAERKKKERDGKAAKTSRPKRDKSVTREEKRREEYSSSPPTPSCDPDWVAVTTEIFNLGLQTAKRATDAARGNGASLSDVRAVLKHWQAHRMGKTAAWTVGALGARIEACLPGSDPTAAWVPQSEAYMAEKRRQDQAAQFARERALAAAQRQEG